MNAELTLAIDELRSRPAERIWFIPVLLDSVELPEREIGGGETLSSLHQVLLYENWDAGVEALLRVLAPQKTPLDLIRSSLRIEVNDLLIENKPLLTVLQSGESVYNWAHYWLHSVWSLTILVWNTSNEALPVAPNGLSLRLPTFIAVRRDDIVGRTPLENQIEYQLELEAPLFPGIEQARSVRFISHGSQAAFEVCLKLRTDSGSLEYPFSMHLVGASGYFVGH